MDPRLLRLYNEELLHLRETAGGVSGVASYSTELFEHETAARMIHAYARLLDALVAEPDAAISAPAPADEAELGRVREWSRNEVALPTERSVHAAIARRAASWRSHSAWFGSDGMVTVSPRSRPARAASTRSSADITICAGSSWTGLPAMSQNSVAVAPGRTACTRTPLSAIS